MWKDQTQRFSSVKSKAAPKKTPVAQECLFWGMIYLFDKHSLKDEIV